MKRAHCTIKMTVDVDLPDELLDEALLSEAQLVENIEAARGKFSIVDFRDVVIDEIEAIDIASDRALNYPLNADERRVCMQFGEFLMIALGYGCWKGGSKFTNDTLRSFEAAFNRAPALMRGPKTPETQRQLGELHGNVEVLEAATREGWQPVTHCATKREPHNHADCIQDSGVGRRALT